MASNFSPELSYSEDDVTKSYIMENSNNLENISIIRRIILLKISTL